MNGLGLLALAAVLLVALALWDWLTAPRIWCADCGKRTRDPIYFMGTSARCPSCHRKRLLD